MAAGFCSRPIVELATYGNLTHSCGSSVDLQAVLDRGWPTHRDTFEER